MPEIHPIEEWRPVKGVEGKYTYVVSNLGRVMNVQKGTMRKACYDATGYLQVAFTRSAGSTKKVHRMIAEAFIGEPPTGKEHVNHKNGIRDDNRVENLEWVSQAENNTHAFRALNKKPVGLKISNDDVAVVRFLFGRGVPQSIIATRFSVSQSLISKICKYRKRSFVA